MLTKIVFVFIDSLIFFISTIPLLSGLMKTIGLSTELILSHTSNTALCSIDEVIIFEPLNLLFL